MYASLGSLYISLYIFSISMFSGSLFSTGIFTGVVEQAARDHFVISDPKSGKWYLLPSIYLDFIVFDEEINYKII